MECTMECLYGMPYVIHVMAYETYLPRKATHASTRHEHAERRRATPSPPPLDAPQRTQHGAVRLGTSLRRA